MSDGCPVWLLDVDGVLNVLAREPDRSIWPDWQRGAAVADGVEWPILFSPNVSQAIRDWQEDGLVEVRWLTTWRANANDDLRRLLGLPALAVVPDAAPPRPPELSSGAAGWHGAAIAATRDAGGADEEWWKFAAVRSLAGALAGRPLIWTDDELAHQSEAVDWVRANVPDPLVIAPAPQAGLTRHHLEVIEDFCRLRTGRLD